MYCRSKLDIIHSNMVQRCYNHNSPAFKWYGGRGIKVCPEWRKRKVFLKWSYENGYRENLTLDRIDNDGDYEPLNCRWVTIKKQCNNRSNCHYVTAFGKTQTLKEWSEELGISYNTLKKRVIVHNETGEYLLRPSRRVVIDV